MRPGLAYLRSEAYRQRFGYGSGRWLVVTTGARRMHNLKCQAERVAGQEAKVFYFTAEKVRPETVLTGPIWWRGGAVQPCALF